MSEMILPYIVLFGSGILLIAGAVLLRIGIAALFMSQAEYEQIRRDERDRRRHAIYYRVRR